MNFQNLFDLRFSHLFGATVFASVLLLTACGEGEADTRQKHELNLISDAEMHRRMQFSIDSMEQLLYADTVGFDAKLMLALRNTYDNFAQRFGGDLAKSPEYLYKSAAISRGVGDPVQAIKTYDLILRKFSTYERASEVQFLIAFTYDEDLNDKPLAKEAYQDVVRKFPGDHWALQAKKRLETIDMTDEELIRYFMKNNGES